MSAEIASNRRAFHNYQILERIEAGIELQGTEVKSIRAGFANLNNAFARVENNEVYLYDADIQPYERASHSQHEPRRRRKLLLHKTEIAKLFSLSSIEGQTTCRAPALLEEQPGESGNWRRKRKIDHRQTARPQREGCQKRNRSRHVCIQPPERLSLQPSLTREALVQGGEAPSEPELPMSLPYSVSSQKSEDGALPSVHFQAPRPIASVLTRACRDDRSEG